MAKILIKNGLVINRGESYHADMLIINKRIERIDKQIDANADKEIDATGKWVIPGIIDDQVHFRQPGLTHKANIFTESRAALAGGVTSFMEMPNTKPPAVTINALEQKYTIAKASSISNYSFFLGATNNNIEEIKKVDTSTVCGVKIFMGSSTGNMLVDHDDALNAIFKHAPMIIATHCEDEETIRRNMEEYKALGRPLTAMDHPEIRNREGCIISSRKAIQLAQDHDARLHILHISTAEECELFEPMPLNEKKITAEACVHHLYFSKEDYKVLGNKIKCNPSIKEDSDRQAIMNAVLDGRIDVIATDHAPHTADEKNREYLDAPSGLPLVQHTLLLMLSHYHNGVISKEKIVEKMCHNPAILFNIKDRGFLDEGKYADIVIVDPEANTRIDSKDLYYKCGWSPLEGKTFVGRVDQVFVNGLRKFFKGRIVNTQPGQRLLFSRA